MPTLQAHLVHDGATRQMLDILHRTRNIKVEIGHDISLITGLEPKPLIGQILALSEILSKAQYTREAEALESVHSLACVGTDFGGLGLVPEDLGPKDEAQVLFLLSAWLESLNSADRSKAPIKMLTSRPNGRRGMTLTEKIFASHDSERRGELKPGDMVRVDVDWVMASELSWSRGMKRTYESLGKPGIFRNDRFWLAGDHVVDPRVKDHPTVKTLVSDSEEARDDFLMTDYQGMNYTIMHTEFFRERAQPGMLIIGSDSHTCSAGSLGCLAIGLGVGDVTIPLITGETWFKVSDTMNIRFVGKPAPGIGGKDIILYVLKELKRNTVAANRVVEYTGPGLEHLSCDARFAIANMTTEFGGITGIFTPDQVTQDFLSLRKGPRHKSNSNYFAADEDATYVDTYTIDLNKAEPFVALYPSPDDVVPISDVEGLHLDGCFIGACTTTKEDLILAGMLLKVGLQKGLTPTNSGKRRVTPGSLPILHRLKTLGLVEVYNEAGFTIGVPGCSYCVGISADKAANGEVWLSSQNRNFKNRMGTGSIGNLASAVTVAASSFDMKITSPNDLLKKLDFELLDGLLHRKRRIHKAIAYIEPFGNVAPIDQARAEDTHVADITSSLQKSSENSTRSDILSGRIQRLGDFIDTDALAPAESLTICKTNEEYGEYCLKHTNPNFRKRARAGENIVFAGTAFGCGSSRENAVSALLGVGIQCVIAKSFAFIYSRNQPNLGLLGILITDPDFFAAADDGADIKIDLIACKVKIGDREWKFQLSHMEQELIKARGISGAFESFGKKLFEVMCTPIKPVTNQKTDCATLNELQW